MDQSSLLIAETSKSIHFERASSAPSALADARSLGYQVVQIPAGSVTSWIALYEAIGLELGFPDVETRAFAQNPNAFFDWLTDLTWLGDMRGIYVEIGDADTAFALWPYEIGVLISVWMLAASYWSHNGTPIHLCFRFRDPA